jgi:hypothetical protein
MLATLSPPATADEMEQCNAAFTQMTSSLPLVYPPATFPGGFTLYNQCEGGPEFPAIQIGVNVRGFSGNAQQMTLKESNNICRRNHGSGLTTNQTSATGQTFICKFPPEEEDDD